MINQRKPGFVAALPGARTILSIGLIPELLPNITVAVPGPA